MRSLSIFHIIVKCEIVACTYIKQFDGVNALMGVITKYPKEFKTKFFNYTLYDITDNKPSFTVMYTAVFQLRDLWDDVLTCEASESWRNIEGFQKSQPGFHFVSSGSLYFMSHDNTGVAYTPTLRYLGFMLNPSISYWNQLLTAPRTYTGTAELFIGTTAFGGSLFTYNISVTPPLSTGKSNQILPDEEGAQVHLLLLMQYICFDHNDSHTFIYVCLCI
jgi:hypothetical protein